MTPWASANVTSAGQDTLLSDAESMGTSECGEAHCSRAAHSGEPEAGRLFLLVFAIIDYKTMHTQAPRPSLRDSPHRCNETNPHASKTRAALKGSKPDW